MNGSSPLSKEQKKTYALLRDRLGALRNLKGGKIPEVIAALKIILSSRYRDAENCVLFSLLANSELPQKSGPFDFPAPDSIEQFINDQYASTYPDYVLFSLLSEAETPQSNELSDFEVPDSVKRFMDGQYESTYPEPEPAKMRLRWLDEPLQLDLTSPLKNTTPKLTISSVGHETPFHVEVKETPQPPPPKKSLKDWVKRPFSRGEKSLES